VPLQTRALGDTDDLVQITLLKTLGKVKEFDSRHKGAFFAYLRRVLQNQIRDHLRSANRRPSSQLVDEPVAAQASPLEEAITRAGLQAYEAALDQLDERSKEAVIMRLELGSSYEEIADVIASPTPNAARMTVSRALVRLAELMNVN
jgi:RNA polymerase sigma factor (sigma-70 family)